MARTAIGFVTVSELTAKETRVDLERVLQSLSRISDPLLTPAGAPILEKADAAIAGRLDDRVDFDDVDGAPPRDRGWVKPADRYLAAKRSRR